MQKSVELEKSAVGMSIKLGAAAIGNFAPGGGILSLVFLQLCEEIDGGMEALRKDLQEDISLAIKQASTQSYKNDIDQAARGFADYGRTHKGHSDESAVADLVSLNGRLVAFDALVLGDTIVSAIDRLPLLYAYTMIRMAVWSEMERLRITHPKDRRLDVNHQLRKYAAEAGALMQRLIIRAGTLRMYSIELDAKWSDAASGHAWQYRFRNKDTVHFANDGTAWTPHGDYYAKNMNDELAVYQQQLKNSGRDLLKKEYMPPFDELARISGGDYGRVHLDDDFGPGNALHDQYIDTTPVICERNWFATAMALFKHNNNLAIKIDAREVKAGRSEAHDPWKAFHFPDQPKPGATGSYQLEKYLVSYRPVFCLPGHAIAGAELYEFQNDGKLCFGLSLLSRSLDGDAEEWRTAKDNTRFGSAEYSSDTMMQQYSDTRRVLRREKTEIAVGARFYKHHNQLALEVIYGTIQGVRAEVDYGQYFI